ncbi:MBL fold metallo-hydrolase [Actinocrinis puniceicyclus]|uniref:MBL fold metallo-hydrolase n=1 Tax=Actinocrinis puniceicyclus TaxID=977794 RepID=A0A8J7WK41_9ACTN|nr:MBL fold metallo-hydrolase [Actinocrinis puniceicyclus]MBS2963748.1 MBL fold metallo-hydrolase [Actinocrinis puniceicyclus]
MLIAGFPAGPIGANCFVVAPGPNERCVVIDPGQDAVRQLDDTLREHKLRPAAVILTHGHYDHVWSVAPVCGAHDVPAFIHPEDRFMLSDPGAAIGVPSGSPFFGGATFTEPSEVRELKDGQRLGLEDLLGVDFVVGHAPGHTRGSVTFRVPRAGGPPDGSEQEADVLFSGDLLFAGSIGRTDLPGGDPRAILESLARVVLPLPDDTIVLPGHGPQTTIGRERVSNPFLTRLRDPGTARTGM